MNADGKIYIVITDRMPAGSTPTPDDGSEKKNKSEEDIFSHWARAKLIGEARQLGKTAVSFSLGNIGNFTGDYIAQTHVNNTLTVINGLESVATAALAGLKVAGPKGAVVGAALALVNQTVQSGISTLQNYNANVRANYEIAQLRARSGLNSLLDGSRGTEN